MQSKLSVPVRSKVIRQLDWYIEANVQDIYATMYIADKSFTLRDMIRFGTGIRFKF
jgi:DNA-binding transcriptional regulator GbsR (MarR family)